jgi:hypothetical protein
MSTNNRASLLAGLRTGGVRSPSLNVPQDEELDHFSEMPYTHVYNNRNIPLTAAVDGPNNRFAAHQSQGINMPYNPSQINPQIQMQMMQLEMMKLQAQQLQAEMLAQQLQQQAAVTAQAQAQVRERRTSLGFNLPATAGPIPNSFHLTPPSRRPSQAELLRAQLGVGTPSRDHVPMTAAIGGRFATRSTSHNIPSGQIVDHQPPATPNPSTTVISGGISLGSGNTSVATPSKSDAASSWRRGGKNNSVLTANRVVSSPAARLGQRAYSPADTPPHPHLGAKFRPQPLRFSPAVSQPLPTVSIDTTDDDTDGDSSGSSVKSIGSKSSPTTPRSTSSNDMPLSPREEASKKLFEGLGITRPVSATPSDQGKEHPQQPQQAPVIPLICTTPPAPVHRLVSQPTRQPRGPPSGADELGPKNFATRIRRKAIGGLGMLINARERREVVEAF